MIPKFRFYNIKLNKIYEVVGIDFLNEQVECILPEMNEDIPNWDFNVGALMQSTGLFDKNGTEIYEGDILHHKVQGTGVVFYPYRDTMASFGIRNVNTNFGRNLQDTAKAGYEVIGNKFEHPDLLGEDKR